MQNLNYCREASLQFMSRPGSTLGGVSLLASELRFVNLAGRAQKFRLPDRGMILENYSINWRDFPERLHLPFPVIALEYSYTSVAGNDYHIAALAEETEDLIRLRIAAKSPRNTWLATPHISIPRSEYFKWGNKSDFRPELVLIMVKEDPLWTGFHFQEIGRIADNLCKFLYALNHKNTTTTQQGPSHTQRVLAAGKRQPPYDTYHVLTIDIPIEVSAPVGPGGTHASPREHLRRGYERTLTSGKKVWVRNTVVCKGSERGTAYKDYNIRNAA